MEPIRRFEREVIHMALISTLASHPSRMAQRFDTLLRPHMGLLYRVAYRYTGRREDAAVIADEETLVDFAEEEPAPAT